MRPVLLLFLSYYYVVVYVALVPAKKLTYYADFEHPNITYINFKYYEYGTFTAQRYSRRDPIHYVSVHGKSLVDFGNDVMVEVFIYEFLSNEYRRSMIEARFRLCNLYIETKFDVFKPLYEKYVNVSSCPFPKGEYHFTNISIPNLPLLATFPFNKGRIYIKAHYETTGERLLEIYIDSVIKQRYV